MYRACRVVALMLTLQKQYSNKFEYDVGTVFLLSTISVPSNPPKLDNQQSNGIQRMFMPAHDHSVQWRMTMNIVADMREVGTRGEMDADRVDVARETRLEESAEVGRLLQ